MSKINELTDEYKVPSAVPQSKIIMEELFFFENESDVTNNPATIAPKKAKKFTGEK